MFFNKMEFKKVSIEEFIANHKHINYCEAIIYPDGLITYAVPSHQESLIKISNLSREELLDLMPNTAGCVEWLLDYTNCISVWYEGYMLPTGSELYYREEELNCVYMTQKEKRARYNYKPSEEQMNSLQLLIENKIIKENSFRY